MKKLMLTLIVSAACFALLFIISYMTMVHVWGLTCLSFPLYIGFYLATLVVIFAQNIATTLITKL